MNIWAIIINPGGRTAKEGGIRSIITVFFTYTVIFKLTKGREDLSSSRCGQLSALPQVISQVGSTDGHDVLAQIRQRGQQSVLSEEEEEVAD